MSAVAAVREEDATLEILDSPTAIRVDLTLISATEA